jgi:hypothetical protein
MPDPASPNLRFAEEIGVALQLMETGGAPETSWECCVFSRSKCRNHKCEHAFQRPLPALCYLEVVAILEKILASVLSSVVWQALPFDEGKDK